MESTRRSIVKALSWRLMATLITGVLVYLLTAEIDFAAKVGMADTSLKFILYFGHERLWNKITFGRELKQPEYYI
ncbi:MAG: DUF2061 domain-containing protein [Desulfuromonadaceae bacterium]|jgi:uncharacterized membrane protein